MKAFRLHFLLPSIVSWEWFREIGEFLLIWTESILNPSGHATLSLAKHLGKSGYWCSTALYIQHWQLESYLPISYSCNGWHCINSLLTRVNFNLFFSFLLGPLPVFSVLLWMEITLGVSTFFFFPRLRCHQQILDLLLELTWGLWLFSSTCLWYVSYNRALTSHNHIVTDFS